MAEDTQFLIVLTIPDSLILKATPYLERGSQANSSLVNLPAKTGLESDCVIKIITHFIMGGKGAKRNEHIYNKSYFSRPQL